MTKAPDYCQAYHATECKLDQYRGLIECLNDLATQHLTDRGREIAMIFSLINALSDMQSQLQALREDEWVAGSAKP